MSGGDALTSKAYCWTVERRDGAGVALTSHDSDLVIAGVTYSAQPGMVPASIEKKLGLEGADSEIAGALTSDALDEGDLELGRWDGARVRLDMVDWADPSSGTIRLLAGELTEVEVGSDGFKAALGGAAVKLARPICPETSPECRASLGDRDCRVDMAGRRVVMRVVSVADRTIELEGVVDARMQWGALRFLDGANCGLWTSVVSVDGNAIVVRDLMRGAVEAGERVQISEGCDKRLATCVATFANAANFRGEPHLPGNDLLTRYPGN